MRHDLCLLLGLALPLAACTQEPLFPGVSRWERQKSERFTPSPGSDAPSDSSGKVLYLSAVRFIKGYDWQLDTAVSRRHAEIVLFRGGVETVHVSAGSDVSPDRHRIRGGHLYTDRIEGDQTVVSRDGVELFRYDGRETLRGFLLRDGKVHTLGQRAGAGFSYRIDGKEVFRDDAGTLLGGPDGLWDGGAFSEDGDGLWYSYSVPIRKGDEVLAEYRVMCGRETVTVLSAGSFRQVFDIRRLGGTLYRTELRSADNSTLCLVEGSVYQALGLNSRQTPHLCRILPPEDGQPAVFGYHTEQSTGKFRYWVRSPGKTEYLGGWGERVEGFRTEGALRSCLVTEDGRVSKMLAGGKSLPVDPGRFFLAAEACTRLQDGVFYAALTDLTGENHRIYVDDTYSEISFNGYFTGVDVE